MGCLALLALLVLHRAKLLASNQSILALGVAPRQVAGTPVPVFTPFPGERGQGDRDNKSEVYFKNRLFLQPVSPQEDKTPAGCYFMLSVLVVVALRHYDKAYYHCNEQSK